MTTIREPKVSIALQSADIAVQNQEQRILCIGQSIGSATGLFTNFALDKTEWYGLFGAKSMVSGMIDNVRRYNKVTRVDALVLPDDGGATAATSTITITGTATDDGVLTYNVGSSDDFKVQIAVAESDDATTIGALIEAAINAETSCPITASSAAGVVTLTVENAGFAGNQMTLSKSGSVAGVTNIITAFAGGAVDPDFEASLEDLISDERYQTVVWPYFEQAETICDFLDSRWNSENRILDGVAIYSAASTYANLLTAGNAKNSQSLLLLGEEQVDTDDQKGDSIVELYYAKTAQVAAIRALRLTEGAALGRFVIASGGSLDRFGGMPLASLPYFNTPVPELPLIPQGVGFSDFEIDQLKDAGVSVLGNNIGNNSILMGEFFTTYKTDAASNPDVTFGPLNYVDTSSVCREYFFNNLKKRFNQSRLTEGAVIAGRAMANKPIIEAYITGLYQDLAEMALTQEGEQALQFFKENLIVDIDLASGKVTITMKLPIVTQLREIVATIQIAFSLEA